MLKQVDAAVVAALRHAAWPEAADYPLPTPLEARLSWRKILASGVFALFLAVMIGITLHDNAQSAEPYQGWRLWLRVAVVAGCTVLGLIMIASSVQVALRAQPLVSIGPAGLYCPGLYERPVPWSEIVVALHDKPRVKIMGAGRILLGVRDGARFGRTASEEVRRPADSSNIDAAQMPQTLDVPVAKLFEAIQAYRAHFGRNPDSA
jgi:hypothetical protein